MRLSRNVSIGSGLGFLDEYWLFFIKYWLDLTKDLLFISKVIKYMSKVSRSVMFSKSENPTSEINRGYWGHGGKSLINQLWNGLLNGWLNGLSKFHKRMLTTMGLSLQVTTMGLSLHLGVMANALRAVAVCLLFLYTVTNRYPNFSRIQQSMCCHGGSNRKHLYVVVPYA